MIKEESLSDMVKTSLVNMEENGMIICEDGGYSLSRRFIAIMRKRGLDDDDIEFWNTDDCIINLAKYWAMIKKTHVLGTHDPFYDDHD